MKINKTINVKTSLRDYKILISPRLFLQGDLKRPIQGKYILKDFFSSCSKIFLLTDSTVNSLYGRNIDHFLKESGFASRTLVLDVGEEQKNIENLRLLYERMIDFNMHRNDLLIAFGGGVIGDIAGFAASTFHRGIKLLQFPTTLVSQIDSSIGGKTGINIKSVKNVASTFYQPHLIMIDPLLLKSLPDKEIINGLAEMIKYGSVFDRSINHTLMDISKSYKSEKEQLNKIISDKRFYDLIYKCCVIKADVVQKDEYDKDYRNLLNFGHTFGHALEKISNLTDINHGQAVAFGMLMASDASIISGFAKKTLKEYFLDIYESIGIPVKLKQSILSGKCHKIIDEPGSFEHLKNKLAEKMVGSMSFDKKFTSAKNKFILLKDIEKPFFAYDIEDSILIKAVKNNLSEE